MSDYTRFQELQSLAGLHKLDQEFLASLPLEDQERLLAYRRGELELPDSELSWLLIEWAKRLELFVAELFAIEDEVAALQAATLSHEPIFAFHAYFVMRLARRRLKEEYSFNKLNHAIEQIISDKALYGKDPELALAEYAQAALAAEDEAAIERVVQWCVAALTTEEGCAATQGWVSLRIPAKTDFARLVPVESVADDALEREQLPSELWRRRDGFHLTDTRMSARQVQAETDYCVYCHKNDGDYCSKGFPQDKKDPSQGFKVNPLGNVLTGCPLEEKISEMQFLKHEGLSIAALAMVMVDNPMCPATGHRICNDCMKSCIYQKQEPVNIPEVETACLTDVLDLSWGVEIYDLLARWNPLRQEQYLPQAYNDKKVLVMGLGPAGFTLSHHLLMEGFAVVGADGLKIEPLPAQYLDGPIRNYSELEEDLANRIGMGFGGVAEYGITNRWDKNFLKLIYITLARRQYFQAVGGVRFGGTLTVEKAWELGFDHLAIAVGAGLPRELHIPHSLAPGMRQANDFLMALQLTGAAREDSLANLQIRLPAVVIGGGLTGVDTATELQAYYIKQVEKALLRYDTLASRLGEAELRAQFNQHDLAILDEQLAHGRLARDERQRAEAVDEQPDFLPLLRRWGGVTIAYRKGMTQSPAYRSNHEELDKALQEGIYYAEGLQPINVILDDWGDCKLLECEVLQQQDGLWEASGQVRSLPARSILVATGAKPNVAYAFEHRDTFNRVGFQYQSYSNSNGELVAADNNALCKGEAFGAFTSYAKDDKRVSFLGDTHPVFHGSVVQAIASAKLIYPKIVNVLQDKPVAIDEEYAAFKHRIQQQFSSEVVSLKRLTDSVLELVVHAPLAAEQFQPGQFYRLQNFATSAPLQQGTRLATEALAIHGVPVPGNPEQLSFIVFERGASSRMVQHFKPGQAMVVMGPTGNRASVAEGTKEVVIVGSAMALIVARSVAKFYQDQNINIRLIAQFKQEGDVFLRDEMDKLLPVEWLIGSDKQQVIEQLAQQQADMVWVVGDGDFLRQVQCARKDKLVHLAEAQFVASVYGPMQCMLKGVCAQCLQWQVDPKTGERTKAVYACSWQHQPLAMVETHSIEERLGQNRMQETLARLWLDYLSE